jgi:hypothetical protein
MTRGHISKSNTTQRYQGDELCQVQLRRQHCGPRLFRIADVYVCCCDTRTTSIFTQRDEPELERGSIESSSSRVSVNFTELNVGFLPLRTVLNHDNMK